MAGRPAAGLGAIARGCPRMTASLVAWIALHALLAAGGTWLARRYALSRRLVDQPGERRSHASATPRGGGIAIVAALLVALCTLAWRLPMAVPQLAAFALGLLLVAGVGWIDDHRPLSPWLRLAVHAIAAALLALACVVAGTSLATALLGAALALVLVNVWNFMDGIDGIATSQALLVSAAIAAATGGTAVSWLALALAAACAGFLPFNFPRARIFMGDVGSGALGYALAGLVAMAGPASPAAWAWLALPLSAFAIDATLTLATRIVRGERWWTPHVGHLYQRLARAWGGHRGVTAVYAAWTLGALLLMWIVRTQHAPGIMAAFTAWYLAGTVAWCVSMRYLGNGSGAST